MAKIDTEILQDIINDNELCGVQRKELEKVINKLTPLKLIYKDGFANCNCGCEFEREVRNIKSDKSVCSRSCNGKLSKNVAEKSLGAQDVFNIRNVFVKNDRNFGIAALARLYQVSKNTISRALYDPYYI